MVVRAALNIDPETAQITAESDPIPSILQGIPLDVRPSVDRRPAQLHPQPDQLRTDASSAGSAARTLSGQIAALSDRFQLGECGGLGFKPKL